MTELAKVEQPPRPDAATEAAVRRTLGARLPIGQPYYPHPCDRLDLLREYLDTDTVALVVLWLGGSRRASINTRRAYADDILAWAHWVRHTLGRNKFALDLHRAEVTMWRTEQADKGSSDATIARKLSSLSSLYHYAQGWGLPVSYPISVDDHRPRLETGRTARSARVLDATQIADMLACSADSRDALVVGALFTDAIRVSELCNADLADVHDDGPSGCWLVVIRKGGKQVRVSLDLVVCQLLEVYNRDRPEWTGEGPEPLILDPDGQRLDRWDVRRMLVRLARAAGIPRPSTVTPHSMRATAITDQIKRGLPLQHTQELSGHAELKTLMIYLEEQGKSDRLRKITGDLGRVMASVPDRFRK